MKTTKKILALLLTLCMVLMLAPAVFAEEATPLAAADEVIVYYTNDVHTYIDGAISYDTIADLKTRTAKEAAGVLLVDAGDAIQGTAYGSMDKGATIVELMNAAGYDLATLGNHEFDYNMDGAMAAIEAAAYPYISCNFYHEKDGVVGESVLDAYKVYEIGGLKIAFIGITTPESFTKSTPAYFQDEEGNYIYGIAGGEDGEELYAAVQDTIDLVTEAEAPDYIIALAHLGDDPASLPWTSEEVIANTTGLDALIDGHSHSTVPMKEVEDANGNAVILTQTGEYFGAIGRMVITAEGIETGLINIVKIEDPETEDILESYVALMTDAETNERIDWTLGSDKAVAAIKDAWITEIDEKLGEVIGTAEVSLGNFDAKGNRLVRSQETNTGDFCADALYFLFDEMDMDVDVAIMNGGGVRNKTDITGEISYKTCKEIHTFGNVACLQTITGQQLLDALEWGAQNAGAGENGGFLHVSGVKYTIELGIESTVQADDKGVWIGGPTGEYRVQDVLILQDGEWVELDLDAQYNLAGYNYTLRDLGDGFAMFDGAVNVLDYVMEDYMVVANYVKAFENATVKATNSPLNVKYENFGADYGTLDGSGRITRVGHSHAKEALAYVEAKEACHADGMMAYYYCAECDCVFAEDMMVTNRKNLVIPADNELSYVPAAEACHVPGIAEYWYCVECEAVYADEAGTILTNRKNLETAPVCELAYVPAAESCHVPGTAEYWYCPKCEAVYADEAGTQLTNRKNLETPADCEPEYFEAKAATCHGLGNIEYWFCPECEAYFQDEACTQLTNSKRVILPELGSENMEHYEAVAATCHGRGNVEYWYCADCGGYYLDEACTQLTNALSIYLPELGSENVVHVEAVAPTALKNGNIEYWYCADCGGYWQDEACTQLTNAKRVVLPATSTPVEVFPDVKADEWYVDAVNYVLSKGMMEGHENGTFTPNEALTRAQLVQILYNVAGRPEVKTSKEFSDVAKADWFYPAVMWAAENGIVEGIGDGTYAPNAAVTREQMVTIFWRYAGKPEAEADKITFVDAEEIDAYAQDAVAWAVEAKVVKGVGDDKFNADGNSTRAQAAQVLMNFFA